MGPTLGVGPTQGGRLPPLPPSPVYALCAGHFSRPLLDPQALVWQLTEGAHISPWCLPMEPSRSRQRARQLEAALAVCRGLSAPKLHEKVDSIDTGAEATTALSFHAVHPFLACADGRGFIHVAHYEKGHQSNVFHVASGAGLGYADGGGGRCPLVQVTFLRQLNEQDSNLLMAGTAGGTVHIWRTYSLPVSGCAVRCCHVSAPCLV